jgi:hypothetical protein
MFGFSGESLWDFIQLGAFIYVVIILSRGIQVCLAKSGISVGRGVWVFVALFLLAIFGISGEIIWSLAIANVIILTLVFFVLSLIFGGMAAGSLFRRGSLAAVPGLLLLAASILLGFIEPWLGATLQVVFLGLNIYIEYQDVYGAIQLTFLDNEIFYYIFVWPPLILLFVLTDILFISDLWGQVWTAVIVTGITLIGMAFGYYRSG